MRRTLLLSLIVLAAPSVALAAPVARQLELHIGREPSTTPLGEPVRHRIDGAPEGPAIATLTQTDEHHLVVRPGEQAGTARIVLATDQAFAVWSLRVDDEPVTVSPEAEAAAAKACPDLRRRSDRLEVTVTHSDCLEALAPLTAVLEVSQVRVSWNTDGLRAQLARHQAALAELPDAASLKLGFIGAELQLRGVLTDSASLDAVRLALFDASVGPLLLDLSKLKLAR